jgi:hypothetical protein
MSISNTIQGNLSERSIDFLLDSSKLLLQEKNNKSKDERAKKKKLTRIFNPIFLSIVARTTGTGPGRIGATAGTA